MSNKNNTRRNNSTKLKISSNTCGLDPKKLHQPKMATTITMDNFSIDANSRTIFIQVEPEAIFGNEKQLIENASQYYAILTYNANVLKACKNAYKYVYGTTWITPDQYNNIDISKKVFRITSITGSKSGLAGYKLRRNSYNQQNLITSVPTRFFISGHSHNIPARKNKNTPKLNVKNKISVFTDSQFSLVIENSRQENYFTEKLCDCVITKTIPVYWGCPNIGEYFDTTGWIILEDESVEHLAKKINALTPEYYINHIKTVEKNFKRVKEYIDMNENVNRGLRKIPDY